MNINSNNAGHVNPAVEINDFSESLWKSLETQLQKAVLETDGPRIAAFDADGTLWDADAGETFFDWQVKNCGLPGLPADPYAHYHSLKFPDPRVAYLWLAQISAGHSLKQVREWAQACFASHQQWPVFQSQRRLISLLRSLDFEIYIVTASIKWAVEPVAALVGVDHDHVLGITTELVKSNVAADELLIGTKAVHPITWRQGKAEGLLKATSQVRPIFACGNTYGDSSLIASATHIRFAVSTQSETGVIAGGGRFDLGLFEEERRLREEAIAQNWLRHEFRPIFSPETKPESKPESK